MEGRHANAGGYNLREAAGRRELVVFLNNGKEAGLADASQFAG
jgi:hypothetical protein